MIHEAIQTGQNKIIIDTNLTLGLPMENINKIAGPFVEAWACQTFMQVEANALNGYELVNVEACHRLNLADVVLQFKKSTSNASIITGQVDVKATSQDIPNSGKSPNITSFAKIRTAYVVDPDMIFIILSLKHKVASQKDPMTLMMKGIMEIVDFNAYDLKHLASSDISYNLALGTGQLQVKDIHYVTCQTRNTWEFCQLIDQKCIASKGYDVWLKYAKNYGWIKDD